MKNFKDFLLIYRNRANITQEDLATAIGVTKLTITNWEKGQYRPKDRTNVLKMAKCFNLTEEATNEFLKAADFKPEYLFVDLPLARTLFTSYIEGLFDKLSQSNNLPVILLLSQANWAEPPCREALLTQARKIYSPNNVLHIWPLSCLSDNVNKFFSSLGNQCGFSDVKDDSDFQQALKKRLEDTDELFLLVSRFEQSTPSLGKGLAHLIRSLSDEYSHRFHLILCGGEQLERLKYVEGELSLLNIAHDQRWPEPSLSEVKALAEYRFNQLR
jgi:DNA-binding XRE family transcriptional regulator